MTIDAQVVTISNPDDELGACIYFSRRIPSHETEKITDFEIAVVPPDLMTLDAGRYCVE
jgi:hypothetical protein